MRIIAVGITGEVQRALADAAKPHVESWTETDDWEEAAALIGADPAAWVLVTAEPPRGWRAARQHLIAWESLTMTALTPAAPAVSRSEARARCGLHPSGHTVLMHPASTRAQYATAFEAFREFSLPEWRLVALLPPFAPEPVVRELRLVAGGRADVAIAHGFSAHDIAMLTAACDAVLLLEDDSRGPVLMSAAFAAGCLPILPASIDLPRPGAAIPFGADDPVHLAEAIRRSCTDRACFLPEPAMRAIAAVASPPVVGCFLAAELAEAAGDPSATEILDRAERLAQDADRVEAALSGWTPLPASLPPVKAPVMIPQPVRDAFRALPRAIHEIQESHAPVVLGAGWSEPDAAGVRWSGERGLLWVRGAAGDRISLRIVGPPSPPPGVLYPLAVYAVARWGPTEAVLYEEGEAAIDLVVPLAFAGEWQPVYVAADRTINGVGAGVVLA